MDMFQCFLMFKLNIIKKNIIEKKVWPFMWINHFVEFVLKTQNRQFYYSSKRVKQIN